MTAPTHQGVTTAGDSNGSGLSGISRPTTTTDDEFILDLYYESGTSPSGGSLAFSNGSWTEEKVQAQIGPAPDFTHVRYRSKYAGEGATFNITWSGGIGSVWRSAVVNAYRLVDTTTPIDVASTSQASGTSSATATAPGHTIATADALSVWGEADFDGNTVTSPTGYTERTDFANLCVADKVYTATGATGNQSGTLAAAAWNTAVLTALRPATPGGGGGVTVAPAAATAGAASVNPAVILGSLTLAPSASTAGAASVGPAVVLGSLTVAPTPAASGGATVLGGVIQGPVTVTPSPATAGGAALLAGVVLGSLTLAPAPATAAAVTVGPTVDTGGGTTVAPAPATAAAATAGPAVIQSSVTVAPAPSTARLATVLGAIMLSEEAALEPLVVFAEVPYVSGAAFSSDPAAARPGRATSDDVGAPTVGSARNT